MFKALKRWLRRSAAGNEALQHTDLLVRDQQDQTGPATRLYLNRGERYVSPVYEAIKPWHYTGRYSRLPAPSQASLNRQEAVVRRAAQRAGWL